MPSREITVSELHALGDVQIVDVREPDEFAGGHVPGARNIPLGDVRDRFSEVRPGAHVYVVCHSGRRSDLAAQVLESLGAEATNVMGGTSAWIAAGLPVRR